MSESSELKRSLEIWTGNVEECYIQSRLVDSGQSTEEFYREKYSKHQTHEVYMGFTRN